jgi:hypothetical protein
MSIVLARGVHGDFTFNLLWVTVLPVMLGLLRTITLLMAGKYDDPTELAMRDHVVRACAVVFVILTGLAAWGSGIAGSLGG